MEIINLLEDTEENEEIYNKYVEEFKYCELIYNLRNFQRQLDILNLLYDYDLSFKLELADKIECDVGGIMICIQMISKHKFLSIQIHAYTNAIGLAKSGGLIKHYTSSLRYFDTWGDLKGTKRITIINNIINTNFELEQRKIILKKILVKRDHKNMLVYG